MSNRQLSSAELGELFAPLIAMVRAELGRLAGSDQDLLWALRRKLAKELTYDERSKPSVRKALKQKKWKEQGGLCAGCGNVLPTRGAVLDRVQAMAGYTAVNTRLLCPGCDTSTQESRGYM